MDQSHGTIASFVTASDLPATSVHEQPISEQKGDEGEGSEKGAAIQAACATEDIQALSRLSASEGGFLTEKLRQRAWPIVLRCRNNDHLAPEGGDDAGLRRSAISWKSQPRHRDEDQVQLDVDRAFVYYPKDLSQSQLERRRKELHQIIVRTLRQHPALCYFQGYHDIVQVMMLVLGWDEACLAVEHLSILRIRDFMLPSLSPSLVHLQLLPAILYLADPELHRHLAGTRTHFALAAALTMYAHEVEEYSQIARLFDFLLAHEAAISMYLFASTIVSHREELLDIPAEEADILTWKLTKIPGTLDIEDAISSCMSLYNRFPPEKLPFGAWKRVSSYSVLKTTREKRGNEVALNTTMGLKEGESIFLKQIKQLLRQEQRQRLMILMWRNRRLIGGLTLAVTVGLVSIWGQRNGVGALSSMLRPFWGSFDRSQNAH